MGLDLVGSHAALKHFARGVYLSKTGSSRQGFIAQKTDVCGAKNGLDIKFAEHDHSKPWSELLRIID
jgi:hypothetical protein